MNRLAGTTLSVKALSTLAFVLALALLLGGLAGCANDNDDKPSSGKPPSDGGTVTEPTETPTEPVATSEVRAYFMYGEKVTPVAGTAQGAGVAAAAMELLLAGPTPKQSQQGLTTAVPAGTKLNGVTITDEVATVDLSPEFTSGGGTLSMSARVAQIVFTLTQFPTVTSVQFEIDGEALDVLGGEGIILDHPRTRADEEDFAPQVLVESPTWDASVALASPLRVRGTANTFEAEFQLEIADATGKIIRTQRVMATSGSGTRGTFDATISLQGLTPGEAFLVSSYLSAKDGSRVVVMEIPIVAQ